MSIDFQWLLYLLTVVETEDLDRAFEAYESSTHEIDRKHREVLDEMLADEQPERDVQRLYQLVNPDRP